MTSTELALCTSAPTTGFSFPIMDNAIAIKFSVIEKVMFSLIVVIIRLESATRCESSRTSSSTSAISAASTAISLPTPPIAMPTSAFLSVGASFTPSPIMQTGEPFVLICSLQFFHSQTQDYPILDLFFASQFEKAFLDYPSMYLGSAEL